MKNIVENYRYPPFYGTFRPLLATTQDIDKSLSLYYKRQIVPLLEKAIKSYKPHWKKILPTLKQNIKYLVALWEKHGSNILNEISKVSRHPWKVEEIKAFIVEPIAGEHGDAFPEEGILTFEGVRLTSPESIIGFVHEIAHINTLPPFRETLEQKDI